MLSLIVFLPLLGFLSGSLFGRFLGKSVCVITTLTTFLTFCISVYLLQDVVSTGNVYILNLAYWIHSEVLEVNWEFCFDSLTCIMLIVVTFISTLVHLYSTEYMENDPHLPRFMSYLSLFTFFMLMLVTANNFLQMFVGWEGVGVSSYLLINFWFTRIQANKAAIKAMLMNRVGDFFILLAIFTIYLVFNSLSYDVVFSLAPLSTDYKLLGLSSYDINVVDLICCFLFLGAMGKSAQLGLHTWLPDAMEGPTPVSALIHAATMVTAGVFLVVRCSYLFELSTFALSFVTVIGAMTAFFAATTGLFQNDMKKVIAYSTCSQLGYMVFACGLSSYEVGMFHLSNHAFFKALLFLGAGSVIHAMSDEQDMRKLGGLKQILPFTYSVILIGSLALIGFPFLAGFYSKDVILEVSASTYTVVSQFAYTLGLLAAFCTAFYSTRLLYLVFLADPNGHKTVTLNAHEGGWRMSLPLVLLAICSILIGYVSKDLFIGFGTDFWGSSIFVDPVNYTLTDIEFLPLIYKLLPLLLTIGGTVSAYILYCCNIKEYFAFKQTAKAKSIFTFFNKKWFFDRVYNQVIVQLALFSSYSYFYQTIDRGFLEQLGPSGISNGIQGLAKMVSPYQTGYVSDYLYYIATGFFLIVLVIFLNPVLLLALVAINLVTYLLIVDLKG